MKTLHFFFAAALFSVAFISCQKDEILSPESSSNASLAKTTPASAPEKIDSVAHYGYYVRYTVAIHLELEKNLCNRYQVEILSGKGEVIASEPYNPAKSLYEFYERSLVSSGYRIARLTIVSWPDHYVCDTELLTRPDIQQVNFTEGASYEFNLYPSASKGKNRTQQ